MAVESSFRFLSPLGTTWPGVAEGKWLCDIVTGAVPRVGPVRLHTKSARQETGIKTVCSAREYAREYRTESGGIYTTTKPSPSD